VTPAYARGLRQDGMTNLDADQLVRLRISGFQPKAR
jgi:hypothetical protein